MQHAVWLRMSFAEWRTDALACVTQIDNDEVYVYESSLSLLFNIRPATSRPGASHIPVPILILGRFTLLASLPWYRIDGD